MKKTYHIVNHEEKSAAASIEQFAKSNGQLLLPLIELITQARIAVDEVISSVGRNTIETILRLSAEQVAGARTPGKSSGDIRWHGSQNGRIALADRQLKVYEETKDLRAVVDYIISETEHGIPLAS